MTKYVRIENADIADYKVAVDVYDKGANGEPDRLVETLHCDFPTAMVNPYLTSTRYFVVREEPA